MNKTLYTRKEVAQLIDCTAEQVRKNEKRWGLKDARADLNSRCVRYRARLTRIILKAKGFIE